jgi:16S rRNA (cytosine1407-C5)-methyltransferase
VIVANDVQEKRLWTLKSALHRSGVTNTVVTRKVGQWFGKHMTERFDRVLCDAPCTAQGTARKDSDALEYCSLENIGKMAKLQRELLTAAIHACKVGGTIVYSTCTLTPEENEEVVAAMLHQFPSQLEVVDPREIDPKFNYLEQGIEDSYLVQKAVFPDSQSHFPSIRLWPQTFDTEGFFSVVFKKTAPTLNPTHFDSVHYQEFELPAARKKEWEVTLFEEFGTPFMEETDRLYERGELLLLATQEVAAFKMPVSNYSLGLPFGKRVSEKRLIRLDHDLVTLRGQLAKDSVLDIDEATLDLLLDGKDARVSDTRQSGDTILLFNGMPVGIGLMQEGGLLKNRLPRWIVQKS